MPGTMVADVPLLTTVTPAVLVGRQVEWLVSILGLGALVIAGLHGTDAKASLMTQESAPAPRRPISQPVVIAIAALIAAALVVGGVLFIRSQLGEGWEPLGTVVAELEVEVERANGAALEPGDLDVARQVAVARLTADGIHPIAVSVTSTGLLVRLGEGVDETGVARAREILGWPATIEFREVLEVSADVDSGDCAERQGRRPEDQITLCDREQFTLYELGPTEFDGTSISSVAVTDLSPTVDEWAVTIIFTSEGAEDLERITAQLAQSEGQLALVVADEVVTAPQVRAALTSADIQISGGFDRARGRSARTRNRPSAPRTGVLRGERSVLSGLLLRALDAATGTEQLEALLEQFFEFRTGTALEQHVPVRTGSLGLDRDALDERAVFGDEAALLAAARRLPDLGDLGVGGERHFEGRAVGRAVDALTAGNEFHAHFALEALRSESHSPQVTFCHCVAPSESPG